jgi:RNA polymerase sporulation-specific sigma factor
MEQIKAEEHLGLVRKVALQYISPGSKVDDTEEYSDGLMGLFKAINSFDSTKHNQFSTFAFQCIKNTIVQGIRGRQTKKKQVIKPISLEIDCAQQTQVNYFEFVDQLFSEHPEDNETDKQNKTILYRNYILNETWDLIGKDLGVSRVRAMQRGQEAILLLKKRFSMDFDLFEDK